MPGVGDIPVGARLEKLLDQQSRCRPLELERLPPREAGLVHWQYPLYLAGIHAVISFAGGLG